MLAKNIKMNESFKYKNKFLTRILFENKETIIYRCVENIIAIEENCNNIIFIHLNEEV